jgi:serine/threonine protein kinase
MAVRNSYFRDSAWCPCLLYVLATPLQPERIIGREYTIRADVWSTGLSILELVQNRFPFPSDLAPVDLIMHITTCEVGFVADLLHFTLPLWGLIYRAAATIAGRRARSRCAMERAYERIHRTIVSLAHSQLSPGAQHFFID